MERRRVHAGGVRESAVRVSMERAHPGQTRAPRHAVAAVVAAVAAVTALTAVFAPMATQAAPPTRSAAASGEPLKKPLTTAEILASSAPSDWRALDPQQT